MEDFILEVTDARPIRFRGELLAEIGEPDVVTDFSRWHELRLYRTKSKKFVIEIVYKCTIQKRDGTWAEPENHYVEVFENPEEAEEALWDYNPMDDVIGYPEGISNYEKKQRRLKDAVVANFEDRVGRLLADAAEIEPRFAEEI